MNWLRAGKFTINLDKVVLIDDRGDAIVVRFGGDVTQTFREDHADFAPMVAALRAILPADASALPGPGIY